MKRLKRWRLACPAYGLDLVFPNKFGSPIRADYIREHLFEPTWQATGLPDIRFHDLRHTYASLLIAQGEKSNTSKNSLDI
jgi:integrase